MSINTLDEKRRVSLIRDLDINVSHLQHTRMWFEIVAAAPRFDCCTSPDRGRVVLKRNWNSTLLQKVTPPPNCNINQTQSTRGVKTKYGGWVGFLSPIVGRDYPREPAVMDDVCFAKVQQVIKLNEKKKVNKSNKKINQINTSCSQQVFFSTSFRRGQKVLEKKKKKAQEARGI